MKLINQQIISFLNINNLKKSLKNYLFYGIKVVRMFKNISLKYFF